MPRSSRKPVIIAGVGASAGGVPALEAFFKGLPDEPGLAIAIVTHLNPERQSHLHEVVSSYTKLKVAIAEHDVPVRNNCVYVLPAGAVLGLKKGRLQISPQSATARERRPIDVFLSALAIDCGENCAAIILSGSDSDGTLGLKAVKERGGMTMAQVADGGGPVHPDMPKSAIATGLVDFAIPASSMGAKLAEFARSPDILDSIANQQGKGDEKAGEKAIEEIYGIMRDQVGHDFSGYKPKTFMRRVQRRMHVNQDADLADYVQRLKDEPPEVNSLFRDLLINVTNFFRDAEAFEQLEETVIPALFEGRTDAGSAIRIWVPGCATGEEVYSIATLVAEYMETHGAKTQIQIFATDIDEHALGVARTGRYPLALLDSVPKDRLERFFISDGQGCVVSKKIRDLCIFSPHSVIRDPPFSQIDLVSCRNLLIYFGREIQDQVIPTFHYSLRPNGYLFLGSSENVSQHSDLFTPLDKKNRIFKAKEDHLGRARVPLSLGNLLKAVDKHAPGISHGRPSLTLRQTVDALVADEFAPPHIVANRDGEIVHYSSRTGRYLEAAAGAPTRQLFSLARRSMRLDMRAAFRAAVETGDRTSRTGIPLDGDDGQARSVTVTVSPLPVDTDAEPLYMVLFTEEGDGAGPENGGTSARGENGDDMVQELDHELRETRERLQSVVEEYETSLEELKSSNEELVSVNEELQSANEELEASKEELQSLNEELQTVNSELATKVNALDAANSDLENLFENSQAAMIFLRPDLTIRTFTPAVSAVMNILPTDTGRPLTDLAYSFEMPTLETDIRSAAAGQSIERKVLSENETQYLVRLAPYRDTTGRIEGAVVTFVDVTSLAEAETQQAVLISELNHRVKNMLGIVIALARRTSGSASSLDEFSDTFIKRLQSMARSYELLARAHWRDASITELFERELSPFPADQVTLKGQDLRLPPRSALAVGMIVHELATNAAKYGALSNAAGHVDIAWSRQGQRVTLTWRETGGPAPDSSKPRGFGLALIENEAKTVLHGTVGLKFEKSGLDACLAFETGAGRHAGQGA